MTNTTDIIIPDTIEPVLGWKALRILKDGRLASPQQKTIWPVMARLEATCTANIPDLYQWEAVHGTPKPHPRIDPGEISITLSNTTSSVVTFATPVPQPQTTLPPGMHWSWEPIPHQIASQNCRCGIYIVNNIREAASYLNNDCVLAEIAVWGRVIPGTQGARGQYAYPTQLFAPDKLADIATMVAQLYQVPIGYRDHQTGATLTYEQAIENLEQMKAKHRAAQLASKKTKKFEQTPPTSIPKNMPKQLPHGQQLVTPPSFSHDLDPLIDGDRKFARFITVIGFTVLLMVWIAALMIHPLILIGALPLLAIIPMSIHDGWHR